MQKPPSVWTTAPPRLFSDMVFANASWDTGRLRDVLRIGLNAIALGPPHEILLPPSKAFAPKRAGGRTDLHCHRYVEIGIVTHGEMTLWWDGTVIRCRAGNLFIIPPGTRYLPHVLEHEKPSTPHSVVWLALHRSSAVAHMCSLEGKLHRLSEYYCFTEPQVLGQARYLAQELIDRGSDYELAIRGTLICLLTGLLRAPIASISRDSGAERSAPESTPDSFRSRAENYLLSNYHRPITLTQIAGAVGCSPTHLCRHYRELTGLTPFQFLRSIRVDAAKRLLLSDVPIARIAEMVGFDDPLYFSKVFSRQTGSSPLRYRNQLSKS